MKFHSKVFFQINLKIILFLILSSIIFSSIAYIFPSKFPDIKGSLAYYFSLGNENNVPTAYAGLSILLSSLILYVNYLLEKSKNKKYFKYLTFIFLYIATDEVFDLHNKVSKFFDFGDNLSIFYYSWVIPYGIFTIVALLFFYKFFLTFKTKIRNLIFLAGLLFILGEIGFEMLSGHLVSSYGHPDLLTQPLLFINEFFILIEESFGLLGILIFNYALLLNIENKKLKILILN
tara:strand:+ start:223 stop:921 length:699 start_codon:yes stop_codon:yes gene_type:complete